MVFSHTYNTSRTSLFAVAKVLYRLVRRKLYSFFRAVWFVWEAAVISAVFWHTINYVLFVGWGILFLSFCSKSGSFGNRSLSHICFQSSVEGILLFCKQTIAIFLSGLQDF